MTSPPHGNETLLHSRDDRAGMAGGGVMNHEGMPTDVGILELIQDRLNIDVADVDVDLIETGMIDSLALVTLITALEERFGCELPLDDFNLDNFSSARRITQYLAISEVRDTPSAS